MVSENIKKLLRSLYLLVPLAATIVIFIEYHGWADRIMGGLLFFLGIVYGTKSVEAKHGKPTGDAGKA